MTSASRVSQPIANGLVAAVRPRYVCRTCRHQLVHHEAQQIRQNSSLSSREAIRHASGHSNKQRRYVSFKSLRNPFQKPQEPPSVEDVVPMQPYVEATTWDKLEHMGHQGHWRDLPSDPKDDYEPWLDPSTATPLQREEFLSLLWVSIVECFALKQLNKHPDTIHAAEPPDFLGGMTSLKIQLSSSGALSHLEDSQGVLAKMKGAKETSIKERKRDGEIEFSLPELERQLSVARFDFRDPITFTILKRFSQLTGHRIPDPLLNTVIQGNKPLTEFIDLLTQNAKPKPKKFAEMLLAKQKKALDFTAREKLQVALAEETLSAPEITETQAAEGLERSTKKKQKFQPLGPNVMIFPRRETRVDREMEVGRWKVIKRELENRGLPVYAHPSLVPAGEKWRNDGDRVAEAEAERDL